MKLQRSVSWLAIAGALVASLTDCATVPTSPGDVQADSLARAEEAFAAASV